ncbi:DUF397 domain-containing protein [Streptomyces sp. NPDC050147]|uniref:DUF397 domain-containing protein n=1 Tax=Streptomyces sp. NPDC050147 TaxID=3155513 RepID=UPI003421E127
MTQQTAWQKSSYSGGGDSSDCVELSAQQQQGHQGQQGTVKLRESDAPYTELSTTPQSLAHLIRHVKTQGPDRRPRS